MRHLATDKPMYIDILAAIFGKREEKECKPIDLFFIFLTPGL
jgi:hypothetical protein